MADPKKSPHGESQGEKRPGTGGEPQPKDLHRHPPHTDQSGPHQPAQDKIPFPEEDKKKSGPQPGAR
jgi:hypothetical protein